MEQDKCLISINQSLLGRLYDFVNFTLSEKQQHGVSLELIGKVDGVRLDIQERHIAVWVPSGDGWDKIIVPALQKVLDRPLVIV